MHIDDLGQVDQLNAHRLKLLACMRQFDQMPGSSYRLIADYETRTNGDIPWTKMRHMEIPGTVARDLCAEQIKAIEAKLNRLGVEVSERK